MSEESFFGSPLFYRLCADGIVAVHFGVVVFIVLGLVLTLVGIFRKWDWVRNVWFRGGHLAGIVFIVVQSWLGQTSPLTKWENRFLELAGEETYRGGFIANWMHHALFYEAPTWVFTVCYSVFGLAVVLTFVFAPPRLRRRAEAAA